MNICPFHSSECSIAILDNHYLSTDSERVRFSVENELVFTVRLHLPVGI